MIKKTAIVAFTAVEVYGSQFIKSFLKRKVKQHFRGTVPKSGIGGRLRHRFMAHRFLHACGKERAIPTRGYRTGELIIQRHDASHLHMDVSIIDDDDRELFRGARAGEAISDIMPDGRRKMWFQQPEHLAQYSREFEGEIESGYGKGTVSKELHIKVDILKSDENKIKFRVYDHELAGTYSMNKLEPGWLITKVKEKDLPIEGKHRYKISEREQKEDTIYEHKVDGHHVHFAIEEDQNYIWSWRESKRTGGAIRYEDKFPKWKSYNRTDTYNPTNSGGKYQAAQKQELLDLTVEFKGTKGRAELVWCTRLRKQEWSAVTLGMQRRCHVGLLPSWGLRYNTRVYRPAGAESLVWLSGRLNSGVWVARSGLSGENRRQGEACLVVFDIETWKGRDVRSLPYGEKLDMMDELAATYPFIMVPRRYSSEYDAWYDLVQHEGREGYIAKNTMQPSPYCDSTIYWPKVKNRDFLDAKIVNIYPLVEKSGRVDHSRMGKLEVVDQYGRRFKVGSGYSDFQREWFAQHSEEVVADESVIKVRYDPKLEVRSGVHAPVYKGVHTGKSEGVITELSLYEYADGDKNQVYAMKNR